MAGASYDEDMDFDGEDDGEGKALVQTLLTAWVSEKAAPEILQYETETVQTLLEMVADQDVQSQEHSSDTINHRFLFNVYQTEIARIRFLIRAYLRTRLHKIEKYAVHILKEASLQSRLSEHELQYANEYRENLRRHMSAAVLSAMPPNVANLEAQTKKEDMVPKPNLDTHVFCYATDNLGMVQVGVGEETNVSIDKGDLYILRYGVVAQFLRDGRVMLL